MMKEKKIEIVTILTYLISVKIDNEDNIQVCYSTEQKRDEAYDDLWDQFKKFKKEGFFNFGNTILNISKILTITKIENTIIGTKIDE